MNILTIQSQVVYGHVGNSAAAFVLQRLGHDVWQVPTVLYSNHLGKPSFKGRVVPVDQARDLIQGLDDLGALERTDAILTGYLGSADLAHMAGEVVDRLRAKKPDLLFACDPVMGDDGALYVNPDLAEAIAAFLAPKADILFPNEFELTRLSGHSVKTRETALAALRALWRRGRPQVVIGTGLSDDQAPSQLRCMALDRDGVIERVVPKRRIAVSGTGDCFAALYLGRYLVTRDLRGAFDFAVRAMDLIVAHTEAKGSDELQIVPTQALWGPGASPDTGA
jgi:pyridoxine kinase